MNRSSGVEVQLHVFFTSVLGTFQAALLYSRGKGP
jgi:hypothetical protein